MDERHALGVTGKMDDGKTRWKIAPAGLGRRKIMGVKAARWRASALLGDDLQYFAYHELCPFDGIIGVIL